MPRTTAKQIRIQFLQDRPADQDFFGTHRDLADAVASALDSNPELRTIGLLGKWGSGKSTVLRELERRISSSTNLSDIEMFMFDAWEHQGEPVRRSFLESLFGFLTERKLIEAADWQADIDLLSGRLGVTENIETPELTKPAKRIFWSLTLIPLGLSLFGLDTLKDGLGRTTTPAGQFALLLSLVCFLIPASLVLHGIFTAAKSKKTGDEEVIGLIINKKVNRVKTRTIKSPEPTAIEFAETCDSLIAEVKRRSHRLLCVVDNLDRLPAKDALETWSAIRSIFAKAHVDSTEQNHPFVLVPMDHSALLASFGGDPTDERAKSFIDKTFDLTFRVPPPVRSDWKNFLRTQLETVFGKDVIEDRTMYFIERVFDNRHGTANEFPTPRIINRFANSVAATWLARRADDFPLEIVSLFVSYLEDIDRSVLNFAQREDLRFFDDDFPDWRDQIAALYFGVELDKSRQVLLERPLSNAINSRDVSAFASLMRYPGSFKVFRDTITGFAYDSVTTDSQDFIFSCAAMLETVQGNTEAVKRSWAYLLDRIIESNPAPDLESFSGKVGPFLRNLSDRQLARFLPLALRWLSHRAVLVDDEGSLAELASAYQLLKASDPSGKTAMLALRGEPPTVVNSIYWINGNEILEASTKSEVEFSKLSPDLVKLVNDDDEAMVVHEVLAFRRKFPKAFPQENVIALGPIREASIAVLETGGISSLTDWAAMNLGIMALLTQKSAEEVDAMIDAGHLQARLTEAVSEDEFNTAGVLVAVAIARGKPFAIELPHEETPDVLEALENALDQFTTNTLSLVWKAQAAAPAQAFMAQALHYMIHRRDLSDSELDQIAGNTEFYFGPLDKSDRRALAKKVGQNEQRVARIGKLSPSSLLVDILSPLIRLGVSDAAKQCKASVENLSGESWKSFLEGHGHWVLELLEKCPADYKLSVNSAGVTQAIEFINERSAVLNPSERARLRRLFLRFNGHAERKVIDAIVLQSRTHAKGALGLFKALEPVVSDFIANHASTEQLFAVLGGVSVITLGRSWLEGQTTSLQKGFGRVERRARSEIQSWFAEAKTRKPRVQANWIEMMSHRLGFQ